MRRALLAAAALLVLSGCGDDDGDDDAATTTTTTTTSTSTSASPTTSAAPAVSLDAVDVRLTEIVRVEQPIDLATAADGTIFIAEKTGRVHRLDGGEPVTVLDLRGEVSTGGEQGLLGVTFSPDGDRFYAHFTDAEGNTRVDEWSSSFDDASRRTVFATEQPYANHNGGRLTFGPDGLLYLGLGDGGAGGDPHGNGQDPSSPLGKILRWDPVAGGEPERWAIGLRNPWRFSFDGETGDVWVGDVGQNAWEEISRIPAGTAAGVNLGWNRYEGTHAFEDAGPRDGLVFPVFEYGHDAGQSVVGGFVHRGPHAAWQGVYFFTDTYSASLQALLDGRHRDLGVEVPGGMVSSFGEDAEGQLYVLSLDGGVFRMDPA